MAMPCPRCPDTTLTEGVGVLHEAVCPGCQGRFLDEHGAARVVGAELGLEPSTLRELAALFGGRSLTCPGCGQQTRPVTLRSVPVDVCFGCGGLWCDAGELEQMSGGMHREIEAPPVLAPEALGGVDASAPSAAEEAAALSALGRLPPGGAAVFLSSADPPNADAVWEALGAYAQYSRPDLMMLVRRAAGVLVDGVGKLDAERIAATLSAHGVPAVVDDTRWVDLELPPSTPKCEVRDEGIVFFDLHGRQAPVRWADVVALGVGTVPFRADNPSQTHLTTNVGARHRARGYSLGAYRANPSASVTFHELRAVDQVTKPALVASVLTAKHHFQLVDGCGVLGVDDARARGKPLEAAVRAVGANIDPDALTNGARALLEGKRPPDYPQPVVFLREVAWKGWWRMGGSERFAA